MREKNRTSKKYTNSFKWVHNHPGPKLQKKILRSSYTKFYLKTKSKFKFCQKSVHNITLGVLDLGVSVNAVTWRYFAVAVDIQSPGTTK